MDNRSNIAQEEIFGPVISMIPADSEDDAVGIANDSIYGLNGAVFTNDGEHTYNVGREGGPENFHAYTETKTILLD